MGNIFKRYLRSGKQSNQDVGSEMHNKIKGNSRKTSDSNPTGYIGMAKNLAKSLVEWQRAGRPVVSKEQWNKRISICRGCEFWQEVGESQIARCRKCGCSSGKLLLSTSRCPLNPPKWNSL